MTHSTAVGLSSAVGSLGHARCSGGCPFDWSVNSEQVLSFPMYSIISLQQHLLGVAQITVNNCGIMW
jgi:hypothetical protein